MPGCRRVRWRDTRRRTAPAWRRRRRRPRRWAGQQAPQTSTSSPRLWSEPAQRSSSAPARSSARRPPATVVGLVLSGARPASCGEPAASAPVAPSTSRLAAMVAASAGRGVIARKCTGASLGPARGITVEEPLELDDLGLLVLRPRRRRTGEHRRSRHVPRRPWPSRCRPGGGRSSARRTARRPRRRWPRPARRAARRSPSPASADGSTACPIQAIAVPSSDTVGASMSASSCSITPISMPWSKMIDLATVRSRGSVSGRSR